MSRRTAAPDKAANIDFDEVLIAVRTEQLLRQTKQLVDAPRPLENSEWPPDYIQVYAWRRAQQARFKLDPELIESAKAYYSTRPIEFICHWCDTYDPRNAGTQRPTYMPFILFKKQAEFCEFIMACLEVETNGLAEKSRDMGATWLCVCLSVWLWLYWPGVAIGWGSRKAELVDKLGDPKSIFEKFRLLINRLPPEFLPRGFRGSEDMSSMKIVNPETGATISGEIGDNIGRGGRTRIYFKDESAHYSHAESIEAALSENTRVQIDISSVHGLGTVFHRNRESGVMWIPGQAAEQGRTNVFVLDWSDHPEKTDAWHESKRKDAERKGLLHLFAQEIDRDYAASIAGAVIPSEWIVSAIDAHKKLGIDDSGKWVAALDVADEEGSDANALVTRKGIILRSGESWNGVDPGVTTRKTVARLRDIVPCSLQYDSIGVGSGVRSEANRLKNDKQLPAGITFVAWNAAGAVQKPDEHVNKEDRKSPTNRDFYANIKAQGWWSLRDRFFKTHRAVTEGLKFPHDELISLDSTIPTIRQIQKELAQPRIAYDGRMKMKIDKVPDGARSPNLGDAIMMLYFPLQPAMPKVSKEALERARMERRPRGFPGMDRHYP